MKINVALYGIFAEITGRENLELTNIDTREKLTRELTNQFEGLAPLKTMVFVNGDISGNRSFKDGDEISLIPLFAGG